MHEKYEVKIILYSKTLFYKLKNCKKKILNIIKQENIYWIIFNLIKKNY